MVIFPHTIISAHVVIKPRRTAVKPAKETMIITCSGVSLKMGLVIMAESANQPKRKSLRW
jgi:hypothetical protein